jgi:hypothetical protein
MGYDGRIPVFEMERSVFFLVEQRWHEVILAIFVEGVMN